MQDFKSFINSSNVTIAAATSAPSVVPHIISYPLTKYVAS